MTSGMNVRPGQKGGTPYLPLSAAAPLVRREIAIAYCERAARSIDDVGLQDEGYADALVRMFGQALKSACGLPVGPREPLLTRLSAVRDICHEFGYGVGDDMDILLAEYGVDVDAVFGTM